MKRKLHHHQQGLVVLECLKFIRIFNKPEICIANFSVHAQDFSSMQRQKQAGLATSYRLDGKS